MDSTRDPRGIVVPLKQRTKESAIRDLRLVDALPRRRSVDIVARPLGRGAAPVGGNDRAACQAKLRADFVANLSLAAEETDEAAYWLELVAKHAPVAASRMEPLRKEADKLNAMIVASIRTARRNRSARNQLQTPNSKLQTATGGADPHAR